jgi:hypothetical protein
MSDPKDYQYYAHDIKEYKGIIIDESPTTDEYIKDKLLKFIKMLKPIEQKFKDNKINETEFIRQICLLEAQLKNFDTDINYVRNYNNVLNETIKNKFITILANKCNFGLGGKSKKRKTNKKKKQTRRKRHTRRKKHQK